MNIGSKVRLVNNHPLYESYKDLIWYVQCISPNGFDLVLKAKKGYTIHATTLTAQYFPITMLWVCFNCDLVIEALPKPRAVCPGCNKLMFDFGGE